MAKDRPNILDIAPAVQDKTRVGGLMEDIEVPGGEFADMDISKEELVNMGFPPGIVNDFFEKAKKDPKGYDKKMQLVHDLMAKDPEFRKRLAKALGKDQEDYPEDFGGDQGAF